MEKLLTEPVSSIIRKRNYLTKIDFFSREEGVKVFLERLKIDPASKHTQELLDIFENVELLHHYFENLLGDVSQDIFILGTLENRVWIVRGVEKHFAVIFGDYDLSHLPLPVFDQLDELLQLSSNSFEFKSKKGVDGDVFDYITSPNIFLAALCHKEYFMLPRFSLAISDLARAARSAGVANITLRDMQLGITVEDIVKDIRERSPEIIGISVTFGQHDILEQMVELLKPITKPNCMLVFGGSLAALNRMYLLEAFPNSVVATGLGENTLYRLIEVFRGEKQLKHVPGIAYKSSEGAFAQTKNPSPRDDIELLPELDLLAETLANSGVVQLESSRGCSYACSFCPRIHKGIWSGDDPTALDIVLPDVQKNPA